MNTVPHRRIANDAENKGVTMGTLKRAQAPGAGRTEAREGLQCVLQHQGSGPLVQAEVQAQVSEANAGRPRITYGCARGSKGEPRG